MPIEFRCTQCNKLLRTPDDTAGKQAKCPECGALMTVPAIPAGAAVAAIPPAQPPPPPDEYVAAADQPPTPPGELGHNLIDFADIFARTWTIFKGQWGMCIAAWLLVAVLSFVVASTLNFGVELIGMKLDNELLGAGLSFLGSIAGMLFSSWLGIGMYIFFLKIARGQNPTIGDIFTGGPYFLTYILAMILFILMFYFGLVLCIVPGIIVSLMFSQFYFLIIDRNAGVIDSLSLSKDLMAGNKLMLFAIYLVGGLVGMVLVLITCGLGLFVVGPYLALMPIVIYLTITGQPMVEQISSQ